MYLPDNTLLQGGKYKITRFIASGGFGCTYEGVHTVLGKRVAIKELFVKDISDRDENTFTVSAFSTNKSALLDRVKRKFLDEAGALCDMSHPHIVRVYDAFEENGTAYYVMDYIDGISLHEMVKRDGPMTEQKALGYIRQVGDALGYVHSRKRLHLDIKPGNIMVDSKGNAVLIDFGVSKQYDEVNGENTSTLMGRSEGYSPIEQLGNNVQQFSPATDIYALGATLYRCLTGKTPPGATQVLTDGLPPLPAALSKGTKNAIAQSMTPKLTERPQSVDEFLAIFGARRKDSEKSAPASGEKTTYGTAFWTFFIIMSLATGFELFDSIFCLPETDFVILGSGIFISSTLVVSYVMGLRALLKVEADAIYMNIIMCAGTSLFCIAAHFEMLGYTARFIILNLPYLLLALAWIVYLLKSKRVKAVIPRVSRRMYKRDFVIMSVFGLLVIIMCLVWLL